MEEVLHMSRPTLSALIIINLRLVDSRPAARYDLYPTR